MILLHLAAFVVFLRALDAILADMSYLRCVTKWAQQHNGERYELNMVVVTGVCSG